MIIIYPNYSLYIIIFYRIMKHKLHKLLHLGTIILMLTPLSQQTIDYTIYPLMVGKEALADQSSFINTFEIDK